MSGPNYPPQASPPPGYFNPQPPPGYFNPQPPPSRVNPMAIVAIFIGAMVGLALVAAIVILFSQPAPPVPPCPTGERCAPQPSLPPVSQVSPRPTTVLPSAGATAPATPSTTLAPGQTATPIPQPSATPMSDSPPLVSETLWLNVPLGFSFEYDASRWTLTEEGDSFAVFVSEPFDAQLIIDVSEASKTPHEVMENQLAFVDDFMLGRVEDTDSYDALLGPSIGYVRGEGAVYAGTMLSNDGTPVAPGGVTILGATDGRLSAALMLIVWEPDGLLVGDTHQHAARQSADLFLKTFDWNLND
ncbi:MAG: hypothetical protein ABI797_02885 [Chloroflexota bacterium]